MNPVFRWSGALTEGAVLIVILAALFAHARFRYTIAAAPRALRIGATAALTVWLASQLAEEPLATYPFMSWHMYGESRENAPVTGYRIVGESCAGGERVLPNSGGPMGRRPMFAYGLRRAYGEAQALPAARERALARTDSLLALVLSTWNAHPGAERLCAVSLQQLVVAADSITMKPLPPYRTVRRHVGSP